MLNGSLTLSDLNILRGHVFNDMGCEVISHWEQNQHHWLLILMNMSISLDAHCSLLH